MKYTNTQANAYIVRLEKGEEIVRTLTDFCREQKIENASIMGIGSIENPTLAHYKVDDKKYSEKVFTGVYEVTALLGNVMLSEGEPLIHPHITISDEHMQAFAGHLVKGTVSATLEVLITVYPSTISKTYDENIGLKLLDI